MMLTAEQLQNRKIGGSDVATILGLNPYKTAEELRLEILGRLPGFEGNEATEAGEIMEEGIRQLYAKRTGREVRRSHVTLAHPKYDWLTCHIDGRIVGEKRGLECKNIHWRMARYWGAEGSDEVAEYYLPQVHTYLLVMDFPVWDVAAFFGGSDLRVYEVQRLKEWDDIVVEATHDFWYRHVLEDVPCEISPEHPHALDAIARIYPGTNGETVDLSELEHWHKVLQDSKRIAKQYDDAADIAKAHILRAMGEAAVGTVPGGSYTRKVVKRKGYFVEDSEYVDFRFKAAKAEKEAS